MRILLIILLIFFNLSPSFAEQEINHEKDSNAVKETYKIRGNIQYDDDSVDTIYLDDEVEKPQVNIPNKTLTVPVSLLNITSNTDNPRSALARSMTNKNALADILPFSCSITEYAGGLSYGQTWGHDVSYAQMEDTTAFFLRYDFPRWFSLTGSIRQSVNQDIGTQYNILRIIPELRITDRLTIKDSFSTYINLPKNKNEVTIVYTPELKKYADALKFELGFAQSYYSSGKQSASVSFLTGFRL